ncbi:ent-kaurene oxidase [Boeremia exigua]|uniref:ent-kaurene oxidase n=1 Tax=Boeremia exigua TaxID=749465 RepID=UPI001E8E932C|nr:ent-kaurene oxidase [Boeremia exigua]KAH6611683.1 ent-kaurene oxidase [Boeremia exigua]
MEAISFNGAGHTLQTVAVASLIFSAFLLLSNLRDRFQLAKLPELKSCNSSEQHRMAYMQSALKMYSDGYRQFKDRVYRIASEDGNENIVIPPSLMPEVRKLPDTVLDFPGAIDRMMESKYTKYSSEAPLMVHSVRADLTPALPRLNRVILEISDQAMAEQMPRCEDWTPVHIYSKLSIMVAKISGRMFVGPNLCNQPDYLECSVAYTFDLIHAQHAIKQLRPVLKPFLASRLPEVKLLRDREFKIKQVLAPEVERRRAAAANDSNYVEPDDLLQWLLNRSSHGNKEATVDEIVKLQLAVIFAAIHTTAMTVTNILYSLAVTPEYIAPLREEIRNVLAANDDTITTQALSQMVKVDSYMKEVFRLYPPGATSFTRLVKKGFTLSNGQYIPPGVTIEVPSYPIYQDSEVYPDSEKFDGFRFSKLREGGTAAEQARNMFVTTNEHNLAFGYGRHACPGRFFASNEIKMLLARLVLDYDIKNADDVTERYPNMYMGRSISPDATKLLMFKKVPV